MEANKVVSFGEFINESSSSEVTLELNNKLFPIINVGSYHEGVDSDDIFADDTTAIYNADLDLATHFDMDAWDAALVKEAQNIIDESFLVEFKKFVPEIKTIKCVGIYHPKQYNYGDDQLNMDITFDSSLKDRIIKLANEDKALNDHLVKTHKSSSGFINQMPENSKELIEALNEKDTDRGYSAYFIYVMDELMDGSEKMTEKFTNELRENIMNSYTIFSFINKETPQSVIDDMNNAVNESLLEGKSEYTESGRSDGEKSYTRSKAIKRIKSILKDDKDILNGRNLSDISDDDIIEIGFNHYGFDYKK